jgi:DNA-directed RNA polymerase specialized sigma24 family protein
MNDHQIAADLRARSSGALAELFDAYGDQLFRYCWSMLRNSEIAHIALRDTLVVAEAHIARLADPELLGPWLYSLARAECRRRRAGQPDLAGQPPARSSQQDSDSRLMAWNAATGMAADELEILELVCRHDVDLGLVLGLSTEDAQALEARARQNLAWALGVEILVSRGTHACSERAQLMRGWAGTMTPEFRERAI